MKLNTALIARQRRALAITYRQLGAAVKISEPAIRGFEDGRSAGYLTFTQLQRFADALSVELTDLLASDDPAPDDGPPDEHDRAIGALLVHAGAEAVVVSTIADATGTTLEHTHAAIDRIDQALRPLGMRVHQLALESAVRLAADGSAIDDDQLATFLRGKSARAQLTSADASLIHRMLTQTVTARQLQQSNARRVQLGKLVNAGIIVEPKRRTDPLEFTDDVKLSLMLDG